jgi:dTDP-4-amino-4,6-dideoxygalactose transaminase
MRLRTHGSRKTYYHEEVGYNSRLDALQAAVLRRQAPAPGGVERAPPRERRVLRRRVRRRARIRTPTIDPANESIYNQYTLRAERRDALQEHLKGRGIGTAVYYPLPLHLQPCFSYLGYQAGSCPVAERASAEVLSLPVYPELTTTHLDEVIDGVRSFYGR